MRWIIAFHIISMTTWFAAIFYLPRLYVYHAMAADRVSIERFKIMERKLYYGIMYPGAILTTLFGMWILLLHPAIYMKMGWLHVKLILVLMLWLFHFYCGYLRKIFLMDQNKHGHVYYRLLNEVPVLLLVGIVILAVVKPF